MTPDEERLQRYLEWRRAGDRERAERRRRALGYVAIPTLCVLAVGVATWLGRPAGDRSPAVTAVAPPIPQEAAPSAAGPVSERGNSGISSSAPASDTGAPAPERRPAVELSKPPGRPRPRAAPPVASRPPAPPAPSSRAVPDAAVAAPAAPSQEAAVESDVAAAVAPVPAPVSPPSDPPREVPSEQRRDAVPAPPHVAPAPAPSEVVALPAPRPENAVQDSPGQDAPPPVPAPSGGAGAVAPPTARERVTRWAKGEVQEFRDGVKREIREFRSGYETVRDFFRRRDARSPAR